MIISILTTSLLSTKPFLLKKLIENARRLEIYHTPRNGSWLNVAEIELSVLTQQCLDRRIPTVAQLTSELSAWQKERNQTASKVIWHFSTDDARVKLKHLYPVFKT